MTTTTFNCFSVFTAQLDDLSTLERNYQQAREDQRQAWAEYSTHTIDDGYPVEVGQGYLMTALAADRAVADAYEARERWYADNMTNDAAPVDEPEFADPDPVSDLRYGY